MPGENEYATFANKFPKKQGETRLEMGANRAAPGWCYLGLIFAFGYLDAASAHPGGVALVLRFLFVGYFFSGRVMVSPSPMPSTFMGTRP